jgi:hypothetical protein
MNDVYLIIIIIILALGLFALAYLFLDLRKKLKVVVVNNKNDESLTLEELIEKYINKLEDSSKDIEELKTRVESLSSNLKLSIQDIDVIRFNPFLDTGSDQSFVAGFFDSNKSGVIITCLNSRAQSRIYAKKVINGESEVKLSDEEQKLLK